MTKTAMAAALRNPDATLGLAAGQVSLVASNPKWPELYELIADHLSRVFEGVAVEIAHVGSTSVPGLLAKPVLDIAVGVHAPIDNDDMIRRLEPAGFEFNADLGSYGGLFFTAAAEPDFTAVHVHMVAIEDFQWTWYLAFRDGLRADDQLQEEYAELKRAAAEAHARDRPAYTAAKFEWVLATIDSLVNAGEEFTR